MIFFEWKKFKDNHIFIVILHPYFSNVFARTNAPEQNNFTFVSGVFLLLLISQIFDIGLSLLCL